MGCNLKEDPRKRYDAETSEGATATVFVTSDATPTATVTSATFNGANVAIEEDGKMSLPKFQPGPNDLTLTVEGTTPGADIQLTEDCGDGTDRLVKTKHAGKAPGGEADPLVSFLFHAS